MASAVQEGVERNGAFNGVATGPGTSAQAAGAGGMGRGKERMVANDSVTTSHGSKSPSG
jgi:hypothetical protein